MPLCHDKTEHSYKSIRKNAFFLDWRTQPSNKKYYPHFYQRIKIKDHKELENLELIGKITYEKQYPDGNYQLRSYPSAGGLYPSEIYIQLRGIKGIISGIYHFEPENETLCLIHEINHDGVEYYFKDQEKQNGFIFLISSIYFRSSWKYQNRSIRYILLDCVHVLGSIYSTLCVMDKTQKLQFDFDKLELNKIFGFRDDEMFLSSLLSSTSSSKNTVPIKTQFPYVCGCDYLESNNFIEQSYKHTAMYESCTIQDFDFFKDITTNILKNAILNRRSIRAFKRESIINEEFEFITENIFLFCTKHNIELFYTTHTVQNKTQELYLHDKMLKKGDFKDNLQYLSLEQKLGGQSSVTFYFTSNEHIAYQKVNILSGFLAHIIYLKSEIKSIGCSGIGAYYDQETKKFLNTSNNILYLLAIGR